MARYRCPSASYEDIGAAGQATASSKNAVGSCKGKERAEPSLAPRPVRPARKPKDKGKANVLPKQAVEDKIKEQARTAQKKEQIRAAMRQHQQTYIYVGNLSPDVTDLQLEEIFEIFGTVQSVTVRSARGCPRTVKPGARAKGKDRMYENRMYASVVFKHPGAVHRAMELDGTELNGQKIVIVRDALDLPEFKEIIDGYRAKVEPTEPAPSVSKAARTVRKAVNEVPAEAVRPPIDSSSRLRTQSTNARIAYQFRSRANGDQHAPNTKGTKSTKKR